MARIAQANQGSGGVVTDPNDGAVLLTPANEAITILFSVQNEAPFPTAFRADVSGLPEGWIATAHMGGGVMVAAAGGGQVKLVLHPPYDAAQDDFPFRVCVVSEEAIVDPPGERKLTLRVLAPTGPRPVPQTQQTERPAPAQGAPVASETNRPPVAPAVQSAPGNAPPVVYRTAVVSQPSNNPPPESSSPVHSPHREEERDLRVVDDFSPPDEDIPPDDLPVDEPFLLDPPNGAGINLKPGQTATIRFGFTNNTPGTKTFVLQDNRDLDRDWIRLDIPSVNVTQNGRGVLIAHLQPPITAEPANYPFTLSFGLSGGALTERALNLYVEATPSVRVEATQPIVKVGPFGRSVDFHLRVSSQGNTDTAFRIAVKNSETPANSAEASAAPDDIDETPQWRYLFDKQLETVRRAAGARKPEPKELRLRALRKDIWWFGFTERRQMQVVAVPVTDPTNGGKKGNAIELTAIRWRLLPLPGFLAVPILLLLLTTLFSSASDLAVDHPTEKEDGGAYWVAQEAPKDMMTVQLKWEAPFWALLRLSATVGTREVWHQYVRGDGSPIYTVPVTTIDQKALPFGEAVQFTIGPAIGVGKAKETVVHFVKLSDRAPIHITDGDKRELPGVADTTDKSRTIYSVRVPQGVKPVVLEFTCENIKPEDRDNSNHVYMKLVRKIGRFATGGGGEVTDNNIVPLESGSGRDRVKQRLIISKAGAVSGETGDFLFVTSDKDHRVIDIKMTQE